MQKYLTRRKHTFRSPTGYFGGKWKESDHPTFPVYNPGTGEELGRVCDMGREEAVTSVTQAYDAFKVWKNVTCKVRLCSH